MLSVVFASPPAFAKSELETLRSRCTEQERQIHQLEKENAKLRSGDLEARPSTTTTETVANPVPKTEVTTGPKVSQATEPGYTVKAGDNLEKIARKIGVKPQRLAKMNGMKMDSIIRPGQKLKVPGAEPTPPGQAEATASLAAPQNATKRHTVRQGETFSSISKKHGVSIGALVAANPKANPTALRPGQIVTLGSHTTSVVSIPQAVTPAEKKSAPEPSPTPKSPVVTQTTPASKPAPINAPSVPDTKSSPPPNMPSVVAEKDKQPTPSVSEKKIHAVTIDGEMTYGEFASKHGTNAERLNALNGLDLTTATVLAKGSELYVPAQP